MPSSISILALILAFAAILLTAAVSHCGSPASLLTLERAFPVNQRVELEVLRARDQARHGRLLRGVVGGVVDFTVYGTSDPYLVGLYFTKVKLGSPPREFNVQIDTGSDILWVTCNSCNDCPRTSGLGIELSFFDPSSSSTTSLVSCSHPICTSLVQTTAAECSPQSNQCSYSFHYGDGSGTTGYYVSDMLYFDTVLGDSLIANSSASIVFGMKLVEEEKILPNSGGTINIVPEEPDDMWLLYNLISKGDVIVADTTRKTAFGRVRLTLETKITAIDYDKVGSVIRVAGRNLVHNEHVDAGAFHTIEIERNKPFDLKKKVWDSDAVEELRSYGNAAKADLAVLLIQDVSAELYSIGKIATTLCANIEAPSKTNLNKNRAAKSKSQSKSNKFFENILTEFVKHVNFNFVSLVIIASPVGTEFRQYLLAESRRQKLQQIEENKERVVVVNASGKATLKAVLQEPEVMKLIRGKNGAVEITAWKDLCDMLSNDSSRACYGSKSVEKANELMAIDTLFISDELYRSANHGSRHKYTDLVKSVKKAGGKALVYSHNHVMGEQLGQLTGIAAILRFPLPDLDDMEL